MATAVLAAAGEVRATRTGLPAAAVSGAAEEAEGYGLGRWCGVVSFGILDDSLISGGHPSLMKSLPERPLNETMMMVTNVKTYQCAMARGLARATVLIGLGFLMV